LKVKREILGQQRKRCSGKSGVSPLPYPVGFPPYLINHTKICIFILLSFFTVDIIKI